jgi:PAS domain S-box-containing protein
MNNTQKIEHLLVIEDCKGKRTIVLESATCSIGRDPSNSIVLHSSKISRNHAMLLRLTIPNTTNHQFRIIDGNLQGKRSTNGISVNGHRCSSHNLQHGDEIMFGSEVRARYYATTSQADINFLTSDEAENVTGFLCGIDNPFKTLDFDSTHSDRESATEATLERLASFPELLSHPVIEIDLAGNITYLNPAALEEFPDLQQLKRQHPIIAQMISRVHHSQATYLNCETEIGERVFEQSIHYIAASEIIRCYIVDITQRKQTEAALRESEERFRLLVEHSPVGIFQTDSQGNCLFVNTRWLQMTGLSLSEALGKGWMKALHSEDHKRIFAEWNKAVRGEQEFSMEYRYKTTQGKTIWVFVSAIAIRDQKEEITGYFGTVTDISEQQAALRERKQFEVLLKQTNDDLEARVKQRTAELASSNQSLQAEIIERKRAEEELRLIQTTTQAVTEAANFEAAIEITLRQICQTIGWQFAEAWIPDEENLLLKLSPAWYCNSEELLPFRKISQEILDLVIPRRVLLRQNTEWIADISQESEQVFSRTAIVKEMGLKALKAALGVPLIANQEVIAVFVFFAFESRPEDRRIVELVKSVVNRLALVIERKQAEDALRSSMATNRALINAIPDLILRINSDGFFVNYKAAKEKNILMPDNQLLGRHIYEVFPEEISLQTMNAVEQALETGEAQIMECQLLNNDEFHHYEVRIVATVGDEVMAIVRDITERKQMEEDIRNALEKEKHLNELKSRFVAMTSHEFRTPLTTILSSAELLEYHGHKWSEEKKLSHLQRIQGAVKHMTSLLNDVLLLGKAEAGKLELKPIALDLPKFCQELVEELQHGISSHQIIFNSQTQNLVVCLDEKLLRHILINLLTNAIKYSPDRNQINFDLICEAQTAIFRIQDRGMGIPLEDQDKLFDSFHRANNVGSISGTGLGLAIVKRAVDLHGGTITVDSQIDVGTTFVVTIPFAVFK